MSEITKARRVTGALAAEALLAESQARARRLELYLQAIVDRHAINVALLPQAEKVRLSREWDEKYKSIGISFLGAEHPAYEIALAALTDTEAVASAKAVSQ